MPELDEIERRVTELYRQVKECRAAIDVPAIHRALELAQMHLHDALWVMGADVGLNPDFDEPSDSRSSAR